MLPPHQQSNGRVMVGQLHSRENSSTGTGDRKGVDYPFCIKCGQKLPRDCSVSPSDALCVEEKVEELPIFESRVSLLWWKRSLQEGLP